MRKYIYVNKVGIELEGGWEDPPAELQGDGSVNVRAKLVGEIPSPPLLPEEVEAWTLKHYPNAVNETCGLHVHVSLKNTLFYARLMEQKFQDYALEELKRWGKNVVIETASGIKQGIRDSHPFWSRLRGENTYCKLNFWPENQLLKKEHHGERYTAFNYTWARFQTIECRLLPAFYNPKTAVSAVMNLVNIYEDFLRERCKERESSAKVEIDLNNQKVNLGDTLIELEIPDNKLKAVLQEINPEYLKTHKNIQI